LQYICPDERVSIRLSVVFHSAKLFLATKTHFIPKFSRIIYSGVCISVFVWVCAHNSILFVVRNSYQQDDRSVLRHYLEFSRLTNPSAVT